MVAVCICLPLRNAIFAYAVVSILLSIYDIFIVVLNASFYSLIGLLVALFVIDIVFSGILLFGLKKENTLPIKIYYGSIFVEIGVMAVFFMNGSILNGFISLFNLVARTYMLYLVSKLIAEMEGKVPENQLV